MNENEINFLQQLVSTPSPSGYEQPAVQVYKTEMKDYCDNIKVDYHGNTIMSLNSEKKVNILLTGHIDELGFQIRYIDDKGFLFFNTIGGFDTQLIPGRKVRILTANGEVKGILGKKAIHMIDKSERDKAPKPHELYIDIGAKDKEEAKSLVEIGDSATYYPNFENIKGDIYTSHGFDDKVGAFVVAMVMKNLFERRQEMKSALYGVATVQEEVGLRGAKTASYGINPDVGIAFDVTHSTDTPDADAKKHGEMTLGKGVVIARGANINPQVYKMLVQICKDKEIPYQIEAEPSGTGTDANAIQLTRAGVAAGLVSVPLRYMHTNCEVLSMTDVECAINLLTEFCLQVDENTNFIP